MKLTLFTLDLLKRVPDSEALELSDTDGRAQRFALQELSRGPSGGLAPYLHQISEVTVGWGICPDLNFLRFLPNVSKVWIITNWIKDISGLRHLKNLQTLWIDRPTIRMDVLGELQSLLEIYLDDWRPGANSIFNLRELVKVGLQRYPYPTLEPMSVWSELQELWLNAGRLEKLTGVPRHLRELRLTGIRRLHSLAALTCCQKLEQLALEGCKRISSLEGIESCRELQILSIADCGSIESLDPLRNLRDLRYLFIADRTVVAGARVDALYALPSLETVIISEQSGLDKDRLLSIVPKCDVRLTGM